MPIGIDHFLFTLLAVLFPLWAGVFGSRRLRRASAEELPRIRLQTYRRAMGLLWVLTLAVIVLWIATGRAAAALGVIPRLTPGLGGVAAGAAVVGFFMVRDRIHTLADDQALARVRERLGYVELVLPHTRHELTWFYRLSVTAGFCEELLYRGYLLWYLTHWLPFWPAALVAAVLFGFGHSYQGLRGVALTSVVGLFMAAVYWITGSLLAPMVLHALMDIHSGHLAYVALERARVAESEARPVPPPWAPSGEGVSPEPWPAVDPAEPPRGADEPRPAGESEPPEGGDVHAPPV